MHTRRQCLGFGLGLAASGAAAAQSPAAAAPTEPEEADVEAGYDPDLRMTAPVLVDGRGPFAFVVDTGANRSVVASEIAQALGLRPGGPVQLHSIAGTQRVETARVGRLQVGGLVTTDLRMPILPRASLGADGLIGLDALRRRVVELDFNRRTLRIGKSRRRTVLRSATDSRFATVRARYRFGPLTLVDARAAGRPIVAFVDSGAETTVVNTALRDAMPTGALTFPFGLQPVPVYGVAGQVMQGQLALLDRLRFEGVELLDLPVVISDLHTFSLWELQDRPAMLLGANTLRAFSTVTLDFGEGQVLFER